MWSPRSPAPLPRSRAGDHSGVDRVVLDDDARRVREARVIGVSEPAAGLVEVGHIIARMGQRLVKLVLLATALGGCSKLYDPDQLPAAADAPPDIPAADPDNPLLERLAPSVIVEGAGVGGSRPALLVLTGRNLVLRNLNVSITVSDGSATPMIVIDHEKLEVETYGERIAVPITVPVDPMLREGQVLALDVTITQDGSVGPVTSMPLKAKLELKGLDELRDDQGPTRTLTGGFHEFSQIDVTTTELIAADNQADPIILRSTSSVKIGRPISVDAKDLPACPPLMPEPCQGGLGGPAGGAGGVGGKITNGVGGPGSGPAPGLTAGAPGRFQGTDVGLARFMTSTENRSSGGAGGNGNLLGKGGGGGGGGGAIEISAGGDLEVGAISARGTGGGMAPGQAGGGGTGGVILLRAGGALKAGDLDVGSRGSGQAGRARYDAAGAVTVSDGALGAGHYRGPMFVDAPLITRSKTPDLTVAGKPLTVFQYFIINEARESSELFEETTGAAGNVVITLRQPLERGANQLCLVVDGGTASSDTRNCVSLAYLW
jgi:hypothetical protein